MEIKDLGGFSKPLTRLLEIIEAGTGRIFRTSFIRKDANARAYEIKKISEAIGEAKRIPAYIEYENGNVKIISREEVDENLDLPTRTSSRIHYQTMKEQLNLEEVCASAAEELAGKTSIPEEKPKPEWIKRFFDVASDISTEELQYLWGKILAGEITKPGSFSLRTLDALRNLSKDEADCFSRLGNYILERDNIFFFIFSRGKELEYVGMPAFSERLALQDAGLIFETQKKITVSSGPANSTTVIYNGPYCLFIEREKDTGQIPLEAEVLTRVGAELYQLLSIQPNMKYIGVVCKKLKREGLKFSFGPIAERGEGWVRLQSQEYIVPE